MIYKMLRNMILRGKIEGIETRIGVFYAAGKLTDEEYAELISMLPQDEPEAE